MLKEEIKQVFEIARAVAKEEIALALKVAETAAVKPEAVPAEKEEKENG